MNPDAYMPTYWNALLAAVEGQPNDFAMGYFRAIWHYWHHTHCSGLVDDDEFLMSLCRISHERWKRAKAFIFDGDKCFYIGEDGLWHQKRAFEEWQKAKERYDVAVARSQKANNVRWSETRVRKAINGH